MATTVRKNILITGGNRGIGYAIARTLAQHPELNKSTTTILIGCRELEAGQKAADTLINDTKAMVKPLQLDVTSDVSIAAAFCTIIKHEKQLDILVNNVGYAIKPSSDDPAEHRKVFQDIYNVNVVSVASVTNAFLPLLRTSPHGGKVVNVGSGRGSLYLNSTNKLPPTTVMPYSVSKTALNMLTVDMARQKENESVEFQIANPGHCKTAFNGYKGTRDPEEGAIAIVELVVGKRRPLAVYQTEGTSRELHVLSW